VGVGDDTRFATFEGRVAHRAELDEIVSKWVGARTSHDVVGAFEAAEAAIAPVYTMRELLADPHVVARDVVVEVDGVRMQGPTARLSRTPAVIRFPGRALGADTDAVLAELEAEAEAEAEDGGAA